MNRIYIIFLISLFSTNCSEKLNSYDANLLYNYLALGDSYTIGQSVAVHERWPVQLGAALRDSGYPVFDPEIIARTGWTTAELMAGIEAANPEGPFGMVTLLIGVNNQYRGLSVDEYREEFIQLLQQSIKFADNKPHNVIVISIPDWSVMPFADGRDRDNIALQIDTFNAVNFAESQNYGVRYVDVTPVSRLAVNDLSLVASDGLHPSGEMYSAWVDIILPLAKKIFD